MQCKDKNKRFGTRQVESVSIASDESRHGSQPHTQSTGGTHIIGGILGWPLKDTALQIIHSVPRLRDFWMTREVQRLSKFLSLGI